MTSIISWSFYLSASIYFKKIMQTVIVIDLFCNIPQCELPEYLKEANMSHSLCLKGFWSYNLRKHYYSRSSVSLHEQNELEFTV